MQRKQRSFQLCTGKGKAPGARLPERASPGSAGYDFFTPVDVTVPPDGKVFVNTGVKANMLPDEVLEINIRSSQGIRHDIALSNTIGWVDADYADNPDNEGAIGIALRSLSDQPVVYKAGDRIAQGRFAKCLFVDDDDASGSRRGGFGSSGR